MTIEFCPICYYPLDTFDPSDEGRLCHVCNWFGDKAEVCTKPPMPDDLELACVQLIRHYREICRLELIGEQLVEGLPDEAISLANLKFRVQQALHSILHFFRSTRRTFETPEEYNE